MNNTEKLLRAFIEASGYEIKEVKDDVFMGCYSGVEQYQNKIIDYKVTKKTSTPLPNDCMQDKNEEDISLLDGQATVLFVNTNPIYITMKGEFIDRGYVNLVEGDDFKRSDTNYQEIELFYSYPIGTRCIGRNYK